MTWILAILIVLLMGGVAAAAAGFGAPLADDDPDRLDVEVPADAEYVLEGEKIGRAHV